jgi:signal transduction histidine kinase
LLGVDADWVNVGTQRAAFYTNLAPGNYQFEVEASAEQGIWNTSKALWTFSILPAFYQTVWFYAVCATAALLGFWGLWRLRMRLVKREFSLVLAERARLSRELHDTLLQSLVGVVLQLEPIAQTVASEPVLARNQIIRVRRQVEAYVREARESIKKLRSPSLSTRNLATALQEFGQEAVAHREIRFGLTVTGSAYPLAPDVEGELFRVGQEAITNAVRHADATRIDVALTFTPTDVTLRVDDDGCGFDYDARDMDVNHYGLITMKERAEELQGHLTIATGAGRGTTIQAIVPARPESRRAIPA